MISITEEYQKKNHITISNNETHDKTQDINGMNTHTAI